MNGPVLVTGGAGYVGSHACKALAAAGLLPVTFDNLSTGRREAVRWGPLVAGDILDPAALDRVMAAHRPWAVLHFAALTLVAESIAAPERYWRTNVDGTAAVVAACGRHAVPVLVLSSSCAVYGMPERVPVAEAAPLRPVTPYGASKLAAERLVAGAAGAGLRSACLRYFNAAGADPEALIGEARREETHLIPCALDVVQGRRPQLTIMGSDYATADGTAIRDYIHVSDLAAAHVAALRHLAAGGGSFVANLGSGRGHSVRAVIAAVERVTGRRVACAEAPRRPGDPAVLVADAGFAGRLLALTMPLSADLDAIVATAWRWHQRWAAATGAAGGPAAVRC